MEQIWAPWRMEYINAEKSGECIFCTLPQASEDSKNFILYRGPRCFVIMNIFPYNTGHLMVSPVPASGLSHEARRCGKPGNSTNSRKNAWKS